MSQIADEADLDAAGALGIVAQQRQAAQTGLRTDSRVFYATWAVVWLVGFGALWVSTGPHPDDYPPPWGWAVLGVLILAGIAINIVYPAVRWRGIRGLTVRAGTMWGISWFIGFLGAMAAAARLSEQLTPSQGLVLYNLLCALIPGLLYMGLGTFTHDTPVFLVGAWWVVIAVAATLVGLPAGLLVMALAGCTGMVVMLIVESVRRGRRA